MDLVLEAVKTDLFTVLDTGRYMITALFIVAVFVNYIGILQNHVNWAEVIMRLVLGLVLLQNYTWVMDTTRDIVVGLDERINPDQSSINQYAQMSDNMQKQHEENTQKSFVDGIKDFLFGKFTLHNLIINLSFIFYALVSSILSAVRYSLIGILYKMGPILIPLILFRSTSNVLRGWFTSYVSILCWPILWHIALSVAVAVSGQIAQTGEGIEQFASINFAVCFVLMFSPMIVSSLVAGIGMGGSSSIAGFMASNRLFNGMSNSSQFAVRAVGNILQGRSIPENLPPIPPTPTTTGNFKDVMTGLKIFNKGEKL